MVGYIIRRVLWIIPVLFVVSMMDKEYADFDRIYQQIKERLTPKVVPVEIPNAWPVIGIAKIRRGWPVCGEFRFVA